MRREFNGDPARLLLPEFSIHVLRRLSFGLLANHKMSMEIVQILKVIGKGRGGVMKEYTYSAKNAFSANDR